MELLDKIRILSTAAKYDASCASSGSTRGSASQGMGSTLTSGICHSWSDDGRCISLLKILFTNECIYNCAYCVNRCSNDIPRASFSPEELADLTISFYKRNYIEGLFLSSSILRNPSHTMELLLRTVKLLRTQYHFNGYIHLKAIPGADYSLIQEAGALVDRMSVNIELPSSRGLRLLAPQKNKQSILEPMHRIGQGIAESQAEGRHSKSKAPMFVPAGQSTQLIVGATPDSDLTIMTLASSLYRSFGLKRVYYSAYMPVTQHSALLPVAKPPLLREHRLYQADWLLRFYGFGVNELLDQGQRDLELTVDPKVGWALHHLDQFPVEINKADYWALLRVPGLGVQSAKQIIAARRMGSLSFADLGKIGVVLKRAQYFITCQGKYFGGIEPNEERLRRRLEEKPDSANGRWEQLSLFSQAATVPTAVDRMSKITGQL